MKDNKASDLAKKTGSLLWSAGIGVVVAATMVSGFMPVLLVAAFAATAVDLAKNLYQVHYLGAKDRPIKDKAKKMGLAFVGCTFAGAALIPGLGPVAALAMAIVGLVAVAAVVVPKFLPKNEQALSGSPSEAVAIDRGTAKKNQLEAVVAEEVENTTLTEAVVVGPADSAETGILPVAEEVSPAPGLSVVELEALGAQEAQEVQAQEAFTELSEGPQVSMVKTDEDKDEGDAETRNNGENDRLSQNDDRETKGSSDSESSEDGDGNREDDSDLKDNSEDEHFEAPKLSPPE